MALKSIGILIALCATLTIADDQHFRYPHKYEHYHGPNKVHYRARVEPASDEYVDFEGHHGFHHPHSSEESEEWAHHKYPKPHLPHYSEGYHGLPNSHYPHGLHESKPNHNGLHKPHFSHGPHESGSLNSHNPHFSHNSGGSGEHHGHNKPHFSHDHQEQMSGHKVHRSDWYNPHFLQNPNQTNEHFVQMERRRPLFYPIYPYHPFHPHAHPTNNDEEFETIEAFKGKDYHGSQSRRSFPLENDSPQEDSEQQKYEAPYYHGPHNPHFPINLDSSENSVEILAGPLYHGFPHGFPHNKPIHKPAFPEDNDNGDDFPTSQEAQPYGLPELNKEFQGPFVIIGNEEEHFKIPSILLDIFEHFHHGHGKPHHHGDKPNDELEESDEEGSGEEDIIPLSVEAKAPLIQDDLEIEN